MNSRMTMLGGILLFSACSRGHVSNTSEAVRTLRAVGYVLEGKDPLDGTGLCGPLLPVITDDDVHYVTLPNAAWDTKNLELMRRFENIKQIRAERDVTDDEYKTLCALIDDRSCLLLNVREPDGTITWTGDIQPPLHGRK